MIEKLNTELHDAVPDSREERHLFKSQMLGFVIVPVIGMALLGLIIALIEVFGK